MYRRNKHSSILTKYMFGSFFSYPPKLIGFEDILNVIKTPSKYILINTMPENIQDILIPTTIESSKEETCINDIIDFNKSSMNNISIIIYGKNSCDTTVNAKYKQIKRYGFTNVYIYTGGLFEYLLLNDIYGKEHFPLNVNSESGIYVYTNTSQPTKIDILKYKPDRSIY